MNREFHRFLFVGVVNSVFAYGLYWVLLAPLGYLPAYSIAYCAAIILSYFLNVHVVFKESVSLTSFLKFPFVYVLQYGIGASILWLLVGRVGISAELAVFFVVAVTVPVTFLISRLIIKR